MKQRYQAAKQEAIITLSIFYDFEAYLDKNKQKELTDTLTLTKAHIPISVSVGDTLEREPTHICERDRKELIRKFEEELERREGRGLELKYEECICLTM